MYKNLVVKEEKPACVVVKGISIIHMRDNCGPYVRQGYSLAGSVYNTMEKNMFGIYCNYYNQTLKELRELESSIKATIDGIESRILNLGANKDEAKAQYFIALTSAEANLIAIKKFKYEYRQVSN